MFLVGTLSLCFLALCFQGLCSGVLHGGRRHFLERLVTTFHFGCAIFAITTAGDVNFKVAFRAAKHVTGTWSISPVGHDCLRQLAVANSKEALISNANAMPPSEEDKLTNEMLEHTRAIVSRMSHGGFIKRVAKFDFRTYSDHESLAIQQCRTIVPIVCYPERTPAAEQLGQLFYSVACGDRKSAKVELSSDSPAGLLSTSMARSRPSDWIESVIVRSGHERTGQLGRDVVARLQLRPVGTAIA